VEVKIGVQNVAREITLESEQTPEEVAALVADAFVKGGSLQLTDDKGRVVLVPVAAVGYVLVDSAEKGKVGFGTLLS
jgi:hypothetical protein